MDSGFTFQQCLSLLETKQNKEVFTMIQDKLLAGLELKDFISDCIPKKYSDILQGFIGYTTLQKSLHLTMNLIHTSENRIKKIKQKLLYPTVLVLLTTIGLFFFNSVCIPVLKDLVSSFNTSSNEFTLIQILIRIFMIMISIVIVLVFSFAIYIKKDSHKIDTYLLLVKYYPQSLFIKYYSEEFMRYFIECTKTGISTKNTISIMKKLPNKPIIYFLANEIENSLLQGNAFLDSIKDTHLDSDLMRFMQIAVYSNEKENILTGYLTYSDTYVDKKLNIVTTTLQTISYIIIGFFMIMIYEVLMVPLSLLSTF